LFEQLVRLPDDPILGVMARYRDDPAAQKIDLGVGVYRDVAGNTPVLQCVRQAEREMLAAQDSKSYVGPAGRAAFNDAVTGLVLGAQHPAVRDRRVRTIQAPGGCGALRLGAELVRAAAPGATVWVSDPTWANHLPLLGNSGLRIERYPYYDPAAHELRFEAMLERLLHAKPGDVVLIHACCHNPTGADLDRGQWLRLSEELTRLRLVPFIDLAYQGFAENFDDDAAELRLMTERLPESLAAISFSKNLGLYRERVGALIVVAENSPRAEAAQSHVVQIARGIYSMPPDHGAAIAAHIFADSRLTEAWLAELARMRARIRDMRALLAAQLREATRDDSFDYLRRQRGMFSLLGIPGDAVLRLSSRHHVYMTADSRINLAGIMPDNVAYLAESILAATRAPA
jgi:aspartate aminotransferase